MGAVKLALRCPQKIHEVAADPEPDWSFEALLSELNSLEKRLNAAKTVPMPFAKAKSREFSSRKSAAKSPMAFVMRVSDDEMTDSESEGEEDRDRSLVTVKRFSCNDLYMSDRDDSDHELAVDSQPYLMDEMGLVEGALFELSHEHQRGIKEEIRNQISALETEIISESKKTASAFGRVEKYREARREFERKFDTQYQRKIAEALDNHLTAVQRDHELKSQIEERRIRSDAAYEEAKRKENALQEERLCQEKVRAEAEAKRRAEEAKMAALEAERRAAKEAAEREAAEASKRIAAAGSQEDAGQQMNSSSGNIHLQPERSSSNQMKKSQSVGDIMRAAESAINLEQERLQRLKGLYEQSHFLMSSSNMNFSNHETRIARFIKQIRGTTENVRAKASGLVSILNDPSCPLPISIAAFAKKVVSSCESPDGATAFACGHVIVLVTSQVPQAMDILLAELHRACIYTVPKHLMYSKTVFESKEAYYKTIGYREENRKIENTEDYLKRLESYMRLYGALVQTEVQGFQNVHGPKEGWAWLARFLNALPANVYTAVALNTFLQTAGFVLFRKYRSQFKKLLNIISNDFLKALLEREDIELNPIIVEIQSYIEDNKFLHEPEGRNLQGQLLSSVMVPN